MENLYILKIFLHPILWVPSVLIGILIFYIAVHVLKKQRTASLLIPGIGQSSWITVGGKESTFYYDIDKSSSTLEGMQKTSAWYVDNIKEIQKRKIVDRLAFIEREDGPVGAITKKDLISFMTHIPSFIVRPKRRILASAIKGSESISGKKIVVISDVATTGHSIMRVVDIIKSHNAEVVGAVTILSRGGKDLKDLFRDVDIEFIFADDGSGLKNDLNC